MKAKYAKRPSETSAEYLIRLVAVLAAVCVIVAVLLAAVNALTRDRIADSEAAAKEKAVLAIFPSGDRCELYDGAETEEIYLVLRNENILGYCVSVKSSGFGGDIEMMVGIASDYTTAGVDIVSMSETPGVGSKTGSDNFLAQFRGGSHNDPVKNFDAVAGATISSDAVAAGVRAAHGITVDLEGIAKSRGVDLISPADAEETVNAESADGEPAEDETGENTAGSESGDVDTDSDSTAEPVTNESEPQPEPEPEATEPQAVEPPEKYVYGENGGDRPYRYNLFADTTDDRYKIEITPEEETAEPEKKETEGGPDA